MGKVMQVASFSLAEVTYITGDIGYQVQESVKNAQFRVRAKQENVSGVMLPAFESYQEGTNGMLVFAFCCLAKEGEAEVVIGSFDQIICGDRDIRYRIFFATVKQGRRVKLDLNDLTILLLQRLTWIANELTGLGRGGQQVQKCKETYIKAVETLVELASLQVREAQVEHSTAIDML